MEIIMSLAVKLFPILRAHDFAQGFGGQAGPDSTAAQ